MTQEEIDTLRAEKAKERLKEIKERKAAEIKAGFLNPFGEATSYKEFLAEVKKSKGTVAEYCKGKLTDAELQWLEKEISLLTKDEE